MGVSSAEDAYCEATRTTGRMRYESVASHPSLGAPSTHSVSL